MTCTIINCNRPAEGTAVDALGRQDVCAPCGIHFWGNFEPYPASTPLFARGGLT